MISPIGIVIPAYNREATLMRTLRSVESQTVRPAMVVLVDNGSTDDTLTLMEDWARGKSYVRVVSEHKRGASAARNRGLRELDTDWVMFFDSDDVMLPAHVEDFSRAVLRNDGTELLGRSIMARMLDGSSRKLHFSARCPLFSHIFRGCLSTQRIVVRTELVRRVGGWNESLEGWNDFELGERLLLQRPKVKAVGGAPTVITYQQRESITGVRFSDHPQRWERSLEEMRRLAAEASGPRGRDGRRLTLLLDARGAILAAQYAREGGVAQARELMAKIEAQTHRPGLMRMVYAHNLRFGRLSWLLMLPWCPL